MLTYVCYCIGKSDSKDEKEDLSKLTLDLTHLKAFLSNVNVQEQSFNPTLFKRVNDLDLTMKH